MSNKPDWSLSEYFLEHQHKIESNKRRNRIILITLSLMIVAVISFGSLLYFLSQSDFSRSDDAAEVESSPSSLLAGSTTLQAYELALSAAQDWKDDAALLKATTTWSQGADRETLLNGSEIWSFSFYSPVSRKAVNISVIDGNAKIINQHSLGSSIQPSPIDGWTIDSNIAILRMLDEGGEDFLEENELNSLTMALTAGVQRGRPEWLISVFGAGGSSYYNMRLDASNGEVLDAFDSS